MSNPNETALAKRTPCAVALPVNSIQDFEMLGQKIAQSGIFGQVNPATGMMIAVCCHQERKSFLDFKRRYHVIGTEISPKAKTKLDNFLRAGGKRKFIQYTDTAVEMEFTYDGESLRLCITLQEMIDKGVAISSKTGALKDNWQKFPRQMLFSRVVTECVDALCPGLEDAGLYTPEVVADFTDKNVDISDALGYSEVIDAQDTSYAEVYDAPQVASTEVVTDNSAFSIPNSELQGDPSICQIECLYKGQKWEQLSDELLGYALKYSGTPDNAKAYITNILNKRKETTNEQ